MALLARRGRFEPAAVHEELARAAAEAATGAPDKARKRYAKLAKALASAPDELRALRRAALLGGADLLAAGGDVPGAVVLYGQAFALCEDPARELPGAALQRLAVHRMALAQGSLAAPLAFVRAAATPPEPGDGPAPATPAAYDAPGTGGTDPAQVTHWLHEVCARGSITARDDATAQAVAGLPGWDWPVLARASLLMQANRAGEAERFLAGAAPSGSGEVWFRWAAVLMAAGRFPQALAAFDEALRRGVPPATVTGPGTGSPWARGAALVGDALLFRGIARQRLGLPEPAQTDFIAAVTHNPNDPRPRDAMARLALQLGAPDAAREQFEAALAAAPGYVPARLGLALLHERAGAPQQAADQYRAASAAAPRWRPARVRFGATLVASGAYGQAVEILRPEAGSDDALGRTAAFHLGTALFASGDARGALAAWESVDGDDLKPHRAMARDRVARAVLDADPGAARVLWQHAMAEHPLPVYRAGLHEAALREAGMLLLRGRDVPQARERAGQALEFARRLYATDGAQRADRLEAMRQLAGGDGQALAARPVDSSTSLRERCHVLAGLVVTGQRRAAETALALIPTEHAGDAMPARLRALVAEANGEWRLALDGHLRSLTGPAPTAPEVTAVEACGGCGREAGPVFQVAESASPRCLVCLRTGLAAVLDCAQRAGAVGEVEPVFAAWAEALGDAAGTVGAGTSLALLRAESGDHDAALELLSSHSPLERSAVLLRRAAAQLRQGRATRAVVDLREAVTLWPDLDPAAAEALELLGEHEAFVHASEGRLREAFEGYVAALLADPGHPRLLHAVGLTGYRLATGLDGSVSPEGAKDASRVWSWTIGGLVAGLYLPDVWGRTASVSGRGLAPGQVAKARGLLVERLGADLRVLDLAAGRTGEEVDAWGVRLGMEVRCAEAFAQEDLRVTFGEGPARRLVLGPALRTLLAARAGDSEVLTAWHEQYEQAVAPYADGSRASTLTDVFGLLHPTLGAHRFLILQGRFGAAIAALDALPADAHDGDQRALLAEALVREGERLYRERTWDGSLTAFARAARLGVRELEEEQVRMAADCGVYASRGLLSESASREDRARAAGLLEKAFELSPGTEELAVELTAAYVSWGRKLAEEREYEQALVALGSARQTAPDDTAASEALGVVLAEYAEVLGKPGAGQDRERAVELWRAALDLHPDPEYVRAGLAEALESSARWAALTGDRAAAEALMAEAIGFDPGFEGDAAELVPGRIAASLIAFALEERLERPFAERAEALRLAHAFEDSVEVRAAMWEVWRAEALARAEAKQMAEAELLLGEAVELAADLAMREETVAELAAVYRAHAIDAAGRRRRGEALEAIGRAMALQPDSEDLAALRQSIETL